MSRYQQLVFRTTPESLLEWLDGELEKRGIDCVYTHCILSILQEDSTDTEPDECIDPKNCQKAFRKLECLYAATKSKHQKWKSYSKQILLSTNITCFDVNIANQEHKNKIAAINCLKSVSDDNTIEELIDEVCMKLKNIQNLMAPEKKGSVKNTNEIDKDTAFYIPPSSPTDQVEKYFAAFPPLDKKGEEKIDPNHVANLNVCYANCIRQSKILVQDIFMNNNSLQNSKNKQDFSYGSVKSYENIFQPNNNNNHRSFKCKLDKNFNRNADKTKFTEKNDYSSTPFKNISNIDKNIDKNSLNIINSHRNRNLNLQNHSVNICSELPRSKILSQKSKKCVANKIDRSEKEHDSKRKFALNLEMYSNSKKAKNSTETYFSSNKFAVLMEEKTHRSDASSEDCLENVVVNNTSKSEKDAEIFELISNPCKKFKICKNRNELKEIVSGSITENGKRIETSLSCLPKHNCNKEQLSKHSSCTMDDLTMEIHAEKRKGGLVSNLFEEKDNIVPCKKLSTMTKQLFKCLPKTRRKKKKSKSKIESIAVFGSKSKNKFDLDNYADKNCSEDIKKDLSVKSIDNLTLNLSDQGKECIIVKQEKIHISKTQLYISDVVLKATNKANLSIAYFLQLKDDINTEENDIILCANNKFDSSHNIGNETLAVTKDISINNNKSDVNFSFSLDTNSYYNCSFTLANVSSIIIGNNDFCKFNAFKALKYFSPCEIFNIVSLDKSNEMSFLQKFSILSNINCPYSNIMIVPDTKINSEVFSCIDLKFSDSLPVKEYSKCLQPVFETKDQSNSIFSIDFHPVTFKDETFCDSEYSKDPLLLNFKQQKLVETKNDIPAIFGNWNYSLFLQFNKENYKFSNNSSKYNNLSTNETTFEITEVFDKEQTSVAIPNRLFFNKDDYCLYSSEQVCDVKSTILNWNVDDKDMLSNHTILSNSFLHKGNFKEKSFLYSEETHFRKEMPCFAKNTDFIVNVSNTCYFSSDSAFKPVQKEVLPSKNHGSIRCRQNLLKKVANIDRLIQRINAQNRVVSFSNAHLSVKLPREKNFYAYCNPYNLCGDCVSCSDGFMFNTSIGENNLTDCNVVNFDWNHKCTNSESLKTIWKNDNSINININNSKSIDSRESSCIFFDNFNSESMYHDFAKEQDELQKSVCSNSDVKVERNEQNMLNSAFNCSIFSTNSKNESLKMNIEDFPEISAPMHGVTSTKATSNISNSSNFDFSVPISEVDPVEVFSLDNCINTIDSEITYPDTRYSIDMKEKTYQDSAYMDASAFRGPYGSYSEGGGWSLDSGDFMLESNAFHSRCASLHELETTDAENDSFQSINFDQHLNGNRLSLINARRRLKHKFPTSKKPCTFYIEGNCNRNDCKFSHDLSNITCRFWIEGSCFKGSTCPFLHGYLKHHKNDYHNFTKYETQHNYSLDSEADFPSLSSTKCENVLAAKSSPMDIVRSKE